MRKLLFIFFLILSPLGVHAQLKGLITHGVGAPSGSCFRGRFYVNDSNGNTYSCNAPSAATGTWRLVSANTSTITGTLTAGRVTLSSATNTVSDDSGLTFDGTNNDLTVGRNLIASNLSSGFATTATAAATTTLTVASKGIQQFTGSTTQTLVLPVVSTLPQTGFSFIVLNDSSGAVTVNSSGGNAVKVMAAGSRAVFTCILLTGTSAASWGVTYTATSGITNSASQGVVPLTTDGSGNLGTSLISQDGSSNIIIGSWSAIISGTGQIFLGNITERATAKFSGNVVRLGDAEGNGNETVAVIDDFNQIVTITAGGVDTTFNSDGANGHFIGDLKPATPGSTNIGGTSQPFASVFVGNAVDNSSQLTGTFTANRVATLQDITQTLVGRGASVALTAQASSIGSTALQINGGTPPAGLYRLSYYLVTTTAGTSGTVSVTFGWADLGTSRTSVSATDTFGSLAAPVTGTLVIQSGGGSDITYLTTVTAAVGNPRYALNITLERLQ